MGRDVYAAGSFTNAFMSGFKFVDEIKRANREEKRLNDRLTEEQRDRAYQRRRQAEADQQVREDRKYRDRVRDDRQKGLEILQEKGDDATAEELAPFAYASPEVYAELERRRKQGRLTDALADAHNIGFQGGGGVGGAVQAGPAPFDGPTPNVGGNNINSGPPGQATPMGFTSSLFKPSQAVERQMKPVSEEAIAAADPEYQSKGFVGQVTDDFVGNLAQVAGAAGAVADRIPKIGPPGLQAAPGPVTVGDTLGGKAWVSSDFIDPSSDEFLKLGPRQQEQAIERNTVILEQQKEAARDPRRNALAQPLTRQGAVMEGGDIQRQAIQRKVNNITQAYSAFVNDPENSALQTTALNDPAAMAIDYFANRATLQDVNPQLANAVDRKMVPVLEEYGALLQGEIYSMHPGSPMYAKQRQRLKNVLNVRDQIASERPLIVDDAQINSSGYKVGDMPRAQQIVGAIYDPNRPTPTRHSPGTINAAATIAGRITPKSRLNARQIESLGILVEAGWISKPTLEGLLATGAWPPGKDPNGIRMMKEFDNTLYGVTNSDQIVVLDRASPYGKAGAGGRGGKGSGKDLLPTREITEDTMEWAGQGFMTAFPNGDPESAKQVQAFMVNNGEWVRSHFNVTSQEQMRKFGHLYARAVTQTAALRKQYEEDFWPWTNPDKAPTPEQVLFSNDEFRQQLAADTGMDLIEIPEEMFRADGVETEQLRQAAREGQWGPMGAQLADNVDDQALIEYVIKYEYQLDQWRQQQQGQ